MKQTGHAKKRNMSTPGNKGPQVKKERLEVSPIKPQVLFPHGGDSGGDLLGDLLIRKGETPEEYIARLNMEEAEEIAEERAFEKKFPVLVAANDPSSDAHRIFAKEMHVVDWSQAWDWSDGMILTYGHRDTWAAEDETILRDVSPRNEPHNGIVHRVGPPKGFKGIRQLKMEARTKREDYWSRKAQKSAMSRFRKWIRLRQVPNRPKEGQLEELRKDPEFLDVAEFHEENTQIEKTHNLNQANEYLDFLFEEFLGQARELGTFARIFQYRDSNEELFHIFNYREEDQE